MAQGKSNIMAAITAGAAISGAIHQVNSMQFRAVLDLASADVAKASGDTNLITRLPAGVVVDHIRVVSSVSTTTATLAFGVAGAATKYGAATAYGTTAKAAKDWFEPTAMLLPVSNEPQDILMTIGAADLPSSGTVVIDVFVTARG